MTATTANFTELAPFFSAWSSWTPALGGGFANGNSTTSGGYIKIGRAVFYWGQVTLGSTATKGAVLTLSLPVTAVSAIAGAALCNIYGDPAGVQLIFTPLAGTTTTVEAVTITAGGTYIGAAQTNATTPATWATGNIIRWGGTYQSAT